MIEDPLDRASPMTVLRDALGFGVAPEPRHRA